MIFGLTYLLKAACLYVDAKKVNISDHWSAWVPIANNFLMCKIAGKPDWWGFLFFIPLANIVISFIVCISVAKKLQMRFWLGVLMFFHFLIYMIALNIIVFPIILLIFVGIFV
jgi:hypothetical protein